MRYYLAIDIGASSGRHIVGWQEDGGIRMEIRTDFPAVQIYTGKFLPAPHKANSGLAIEPEFYPDSPNHPDFPSTLLRKGERFHRWASYRFTEA